MSDLLQIKDKYRKVGFARASLVRLFLKYDPSNSVEGCKEFINVYLPVHPEAAEGLSKVPAYSTFYKWVRAYQESGKNPAVLAPKYNDGSGAGSKALNKKEIMILQYFWAQQSAWSVRKCVDEAEKALGYSLSYSTCLRYLNNQPKLYQIAMREGEKNVNDKAMPYIDRNYNLLSSMELVTSDHHMLDFFVEKDGKVFRPWLTIFSDLRSRKALSWVMCENPNKLTILHTFQIMTHEYGLPEKLVFDNGKDYRSELLRGGVKEIKGQKYSLVDESKKVEIQGILEGLGCEITYCEPYHGQSKPVERFFGTVTGRLSKAMPTYCGSNTATRPDEAKRYHQTIGKLKKKDCMLTFDEAAARVNRYMDEYNSTWKHSGKGMNGKTPDAVFEANRKNKRMLHENARRKMFTEVFIRDVTRAGIKLDHRVYYNVDLAEFIGKKVIVRRPFYSDSFVIVCDLEDRELMTASFNPLGDNGDVKDNNERKNAAKKEIRAKIRNYENKVRRASDLPEIEKYEEAEAAKNLEYLEEYRKAAGAEDAVSNSLLGGTARPFRKQKTKLSLLG